MLGARFCRTVPTRITVVEYARTVGSTSPRLRGEHRRPSAAVLSAKNADAKHRLSREARRVRGALRGPCCWKMPLTPTLSPQAGEGAHRAREEESDRVIGVSLR